MARYFTAHSSQPPPLRTGTAPVAAGDLLLTHEHFQNVLDKILARQEDRRRLTRMKLHGRCQWLLDTLPALLHCNQPGLPGYVEPGSPSGIIGYAPSTLALNSARRLFHTQLPQQHHDRPAIQGIYMLGSAGSVAQTRRSDIDLWVCLPRSAHHRLRPKLDALERYAQSLDLELQAFTVDPGQFNHGGGIASSPLLLDEFYRSACWLAGAYPLWWLVPPQLDGKHYQQFVTELRRGQLLRPHTWLDFGPCGAFNDHDLSVAIIRALQAAFTDPHKSLLKLALLETYANGANPLSQTYKENVYNGRESDAYLLLADHLDAEFSDTARLQALRAAWISKTSQKNARLADNHAWQQRATRWGFTEQQVNHLRWPERWLLADFIDEHRHLERAYQPTWSLLDQLCRRQTGSLPTQQRLQAERLRERFATTAQLVKPPPQHTANARIVADATDVSGAKDAKGVSLMENGRQLTTAASHTSIINWLLQHRFSLAALTASDRRDSYLKQLVLTLQTPGKFWLISITDTPEQTTLAQLNDPLCHGRGQLNLVTRCELIGSDHNSIEQHSVAKLIATVVAHERPIKVVGNLLRVSIQKHLLNLIAEARAALQIPGATFIFSLATQFVVLHKTSDGEVGMVQVPELAPLLTTLPAVTPLIPSKLSYFTPKDQQLLAAATRAAQLPD